MTNLVSIFVYSGHRSILINLQERQTVDDAIVQAKARFGLAEHYPARLWGHRALDDVWYMIDPDVPAAWFDGAILYLVVGPYVLTHPPAL